MKTLHQQKGITLLALIITVILLLIISGVTLNIAIRRKWIIKEI